MTSFASLLQPFFTDRLLKQRQASNHTIAAYRDTFRLLVLFAEQRLKKEPSDFLFTDLDAVLITDFLDYLEQERNNSVQTRNARLAAIRSFFRYAATCVPEYLEQIRRVLAIPQKRFDRKLVTFLNHLEFEALLNAPDRTTWLGRRDYTLLIVAIQTGLRVSELTGLRVKDLILHTAPHIRCYGKGRKERCTPLTRQTLAALKEWLKEQDIQPEDPLFPNRRKSALTSNAVYKLVDKYAKKAQSQCLSLKEKRVTPHVLRHTAAVLLRQARVDLSVIALWLGHESIETTMIYLDADLQTKERAIAKTAPFNINNKRFQPTDELLVFLEQL